MNVLQSKHEMLEVGAWLDPCACPLVGCWPASVLLQQASLIVMFTDTVARLLSKGVIALCMRKKLSVYIFMNVGMFSAAFTALLTITSGNVHNYKWA